MELDKCVLLFGSDRTVTELVLYTNKLGSTPRLPTYEKCLVE